jgi:hypothetical protein
MNTTARDRFILIATALMFAACVKDQVGENAANVDSPTATVQGAFEEASGERHILFANGKAIVLARDGAREKATVKFGRGKNGPNLSVDGEDSASFSGEFNFLQTGLQQSVLLRDASGKTLTLKKLASYCEEADDCNDQGLQLCDTGKAYACATNACSCKAASASKDAGAKDSGTIKDGGTKDSGAAKDAGKDAR